ncbi:hypothetical protein AB0L47_27380 [Streptomyces bobili]|uniref:hypothetical protein n=1 Tax=Streptomyces bobili TaxID=67280 RepID=UPI00344AB65F
MAEITQERQRRSREFGPWELREGVRSRASELRALLQERMETHAEVPRVQTLAREALQELEKAREALTHREHSRYKMGSHLAVGQIHLDTAHNLLLRLSRPDEVIPMMPGVLAIVQEHLSPSDPRRVTAERIDQSITRTGELSPQDLESILDAVSVARQASIRETLRVRSFVNIVGWVTVILVIGAALVALLGAVRDDTLPLCFTPSAGLGESGFTVVCPSGTNPEPPPNVDEALAITTSHGDYLLVEIVGLVAAGIAAATSLRRIRGTATPYNVPVVLALLKLPMGALTAVLGLLLMRGGFVPGLSALDSPAQIIAWAIIFGYSQQLFTRLVDGQAQALINTVGAPSATVTPPPPALGAASKPRP